MAHASKDAKDDGSACLKRKDKRQRGKATESTPPTGTTSAARKHLGTGGGSAEGASVPGRSICYVSTGHRVATV
eukprot:2180710-Rhodomonas_salina.1